MDEATWLACTDPQPMFDYLRSARIGRRARGRRKLRLFGVACCRRVWGRIPEGPDRAAVEAAEAFADGRLTERAFVAAAVPAGGVARDLANACLGSVFELPAWSAAQVADGPEAEGLAQAVLLRDLFGNPFRPAALDPAWGTAGVRALAQAAYGERHMPEGTLDPHRLAVLADSLEEAGCTDPDILGHLRGPGPHVRGCFALDAIIGKS